MFWQLLIGSARMHVCTRVPILGGPHHPVALGGGDTVTENRWMDGWMDGRKEGKIARWITVV